MGQRGEDERVMGRGRSASPLAAALVAHLRNLVELLDDATDFADGDARRQEAEESSKRGNADGGVVAA